MIPSELFNSLKGKTQEELSQMQNCEDCKQAHLTSLLICPKHGNYFNLGLSKSLSQALSKDKLGSKKYQTAKSEKV